MDNKRTITLITVILAVLLTLLFLVASPVTTNFLIGYAFALIGLGGLWLCTSMALDRKGSFPWVAALPIAALTYLIVECLASAAVVIPAQLRIWVLPATWFFLIHAVLLGFFLIRIIVLMSGSRYIDARGEIVRQKVNAIRSMQVDIEMLASQTTDIDLKKAISKLAERVRFSDPMSHADLGTLETRIEQRINDLKHLVQTADVERASTTIQEAELLLEERNKKAKLLK